MVMACRKSRIAIQYCYRYRQRNPSADVFWVHGGSRARFEAAYQKIARVLELRGREDPKVDTLRLVCDYLSDGTNGPWFMVLDSADDRDIWLGPAIREAAGTRSTMSLIDYLPRGEQGQILITTRDSQLGHRLLEGKHDPIQVTRLEPAQARLLLLSKLPRDISQEDTDELTNALEYLPLTITQAAAYLKQIETTASEYLELLRAGKQDIPDLLEESIHDPGRDRESNCVFQTWKISFDQISKQNPRAADALSLMATLDRQAISKELLLQPEGSMLQFRSAIAKLRAFSLIDEEKTVSKYSLHRLVQLSTQRWLEHMGQLAMWQEAAVSAIYGQYPLDAEYKNWLIIQELNSHVQIALSYKICTKCCLVQRASILHSLGHYNAEQGQQLAALEHLSEAMKLRGQQLGPEHEDTLTTMSLLGVAYSRLKRTEEAQQLQLQVVDIASRVLGPTHRLTLKSISRLAITYQHKGFVGKCQIFQMDVLDLMKRELGVEHSDTLTEMANLAYTLNKLKYWEAAVKLQRELLELRTRVLGPTHPDTLTTMVSLAWSYKEQGQLQDAEKWEIHALDMRTQALGPEHPKTLQTMTNLVKTYRLQGRRQEAREQKAKVEEIRHRFRTSNSGHSTLARNAIDHEDSTSNQLLGVPRAPSRLRVRSTGDERGERWNSHRTCSYGTPSQDNRHHDGSHRLQSMNNIRRARSGERWTPYGSPGSSWQGNLVYPRSRTSLST
jgi:hypothetical protein